MICHDQYEKELLKELEAQAQHPLEDETPPIEQESE